GARRAHQPTRHRQARRRRGLRLGEPEGARDHARARRRRPHDACHAHAQYAPRRPAPGLSRTLCPFRGSGEGGGVSERAVYSVSELTARIKEQLEGAFPAVWVEGEISNLRTPGSGHAYFTLKDETAQLRAVLFRNRGRRIRFEP